MRFFIEKNLPFGSSISCSQFQKCSDSLKHLSEFVTGRFGVTNYLDDFLFLGKTQEEANFMVRSFLSMCREISCPVSLEKTEWGTQTIVFLGIMTDGHRHCLALPESKVIKAKNQINDILAKKNGKATIKQLQSLTGLLNFMNKAIVPGRAFTRRMYTKLPEIAYDPGTIASRKN